MSEQINSISCLYEINCRRYPTSDQTGSLKTKFPACRNDFGTEYFMSVASELVNNVSCLCKLFDTGPCPHIVNF